MTPREKYGDDFICQHFTLKKADGRFIHAHDIVVCIAPKHDAASTLVYAWEVFRELAQWVCTEFASCPSSETYRVIVAWSRSVRERQGHIVKIWCDLAGVREAASFAKVEDCAARFGSAWLPFKNWQKNVFAITA